MEWIPLIPYLPELEHLIEKRFHGLFAEKESSGGSAGGFVAEMKLRWIFGAMLNFPDEITWTTSKNNELFEISPFWKTRYWKKLRNWGQQIDPATGVRIFE